MPFPSFAPLSQKHPNHRGGAARGPWPLAAVFLAALALSATRMPHSRWAAASAFPLGCVAFASVAGSSRGRQERDTCLSDSALLRVVLSSMGEAAIAVDRERRIVRLNDAAAALLGLSEAEAMGRRCCEVLGLAARGCPWCPARAAQQSGQRSLLSPLSLPPGPAGERRR